MWPVLDASHCQSFVFCGAENVPIEAPSALCCWSNKLIFSSGACLLQRGAHTFFLKMAKVGRWAGYTVNLIHYEDAAELAAAVRVLIRPLPLFFSCRCPFSLFLTYP